MRLRWLLAAIWRDVDVSGTDGTEDNIVELRHPDRAEIRAVALIPAQDGTMTIRYGSIDEQITVTANEEIAAQQFDAIVNTDGVSSIRVGFY